MNINIRFVCDAHFRTGFGHASRCMQIARQLLAKDNRLKIVFQGEYSLEAKKLIESEIPSVLFVDLDVFIVSDISFIDRMSDYDDIEVVDKTLVQIIADTSKKTIYMASGLLVPELPSGVDCIGYQPTMDNLTSDHVMWGLQFAPVSKEILSYNDISPELDTALVAFGGAPDGRAVEKTLKVLGEIPKIRKIKILSSPVNACDLSLPLLSNSQKIEWYSSVPTVGPLLASSAVVICSYGNLGYEAVALGIPLCFLNTKLFQSNLAEKFQDMGWAFNAGMVDQCSDLKLKMCILKALSLSFNQKQQKKYFLDGQGIERLS